MSIRRAKSKYNEEVFAEQGEELRGKNVQCQFCGAKMHIHRFPGRQDYYFALNPGEKHEGLCKYYEEKDAPILYGKSPESFITMLATIGGIRVATETKNSNSTLDIKKENDDTYKPKAITSLRQIIKTGIYFMDADGRPYLNAEYKYLDYIIFGKWGKYIWKSQNLPYIGPRIVDVRWLGSMRLKHDLMKEVRDKFKKENELWFTLFWKVGESYRHVRFCFDCSECRNEIKKKIFKNNVRENATFDELGVKGDSGILDALVAAYWGVMNKEQCREMCPLNPFGCEGCFGAYWGKCNSVKQIELFPVDELTKK